MKHERASVQKHLLISKINSMDHPLSIMFVTFVCLSSRAIVYNAFGNSFHFVVMLDLIGQLCLVLQYVKQQAIGGNFRLNLRIYVRRRIE